MKCFFCCFFSDDDIVKLEDNGLTNNNNNGWMKLDSGILKAPPQKTDIVTDDTNIMEDAEESDHTDSTLIIGSTDSPVETATPQAMIQIPSEPR